MFIFQLKSQLPSKSVEMPDGYFAANAAAMKTEWLGAREKIADINGRINGVLTGKETSKTALAAAIEDLKTYINGTKFLRNDTSLTDALGLLRNQARVVSDVENTATLVQCFIDMDSRAKYFQMKLDAYIVLSDMMADLKAGKLQDAQKKLDNGRTIGGGQGVPTYADVFLGTLNSDIVEYGFNKAIKANDAKKAATYCEIMQKEIRDVQLWAAGIQLPEVVVVDMEYETPWGKASGYIPGYGPGRDFVKGIIKLCDGNPDNNTYGAILIGVGLVGLVLDIASLVTIGSTSALKVGMRKIMMAGIAKWSKSYTTRRAMVTLSKEFTTDELKAITRAAMHKAARDIVEGELPRAIGRDVAKVASGEIGSDLLVKNIVRDMVQQVVEKLSEKTGKRLTKDQLEAIVAKETETLTNSIVADMAGKEFSENALKAAIRRQFNRKAVAAISEKVTKTVIKTAIANEENMARFALKNMLYEPMTKRIEEAVKKINEPAWIKKICEVAVKKGKIVDVTEMLPAFGTELKAAFKKAFKDVPDEILKRADMNGLIDDALKVITKEVNATKGVINSALLEGIVKDDVALTGTIITEAIDKEVRKELMAQAAKAVLANAPEELIKNATKDGAGELTRTMQGEIVTQLKKAGFGEEAVADVLKDLPLLQGIVGEQAALVVKNAAGGSLTATAKKMLNESLDYDLELARINAGAFGTGIIWPSWIIAKGPRYGGGVAGGFIGDGFKGFVKTTSPWRKELGKRIMLTDLTYVGVGRGLHGAAEATDKWLLSKPKILPMKYAEVLPGSEAIDVMAKSAFRDSPLNGKIYFKVDGGEIRQLDVVNGNVRSEVPFAFGRHRIELSLSKGMDDKSIVLLNIKPPYFDYENGAVVLFKPSGARLAGQEIEIASSKGKYYCKTGANGAIPAIKDAKGTVVFPVDGAMYEIRPVVGKAGKTPILGSYWGAITVINGRVSVNLPPGQAAPASAPEQSQGADLQKKFNAIIDAASGDYGELCGMLKQNASLRQPLADAVDKVKAAGKVGDAEASKDVIGYLKCLPKQDEYSAQLGKIAEKGLITLAEIEGMRLNPKQKAKLVQIKEKGWTNAFLGKVNYIYLRGKTDQQAVETIINAFIASPLKTTLAIE
ncbi:MAG: hypothetical protein NTX79_08705 [Candidatus Micrarchaeota archaeon]|nr:hypothetical protein [Candidatus Micrarchaeota archaeon]